MHFPRMIGTLAIGLTSASMTMAAPAGADISPQYPPGRYHVMEILCLPEDPCPPADWGFWTVIDQGPGLIRMIAGDGTVFDFQRFETGWTAVTSDIWYSCLTDGSTRSTSSQMTIFDTGGDILIVDDWTPENPFCDGTTEDTFSYAQLTPAPVIPA